MIVTVIGFLWIELILWACRMEWYWHLGSFIFCGIFFLIYRYSDAI